MTTYQKKKALSVINEERKTKQKKTGIPLNCFVGMF